MSKKIDFPSHSYYEIKNKLGQGAFGTVYKVLNIDDNNYYGIKKIPIKGLDNNQLELIKNEANILSSIDNENIVKYYDSFIEEDSFNIVMEYCNGVDFRYFINLLKETGEYIDEPIIYFFIKRICLGIREIHKHNLIHRDLKPENIFLTTDIKIKIGDFGISKQLNNTQFAKTQCGTPIYMAPEILRGEKYNNKVDIWSLGTIIYELCTSNIYFGNNTNGKINSSIYGADLQNLIDALLDKDYNKRLDINEVYEIIEKNIQKYDESQIIKTLEKTETCKNMMIERVIIRSLEQVSINSIRREGKFGFFFQLGALGLYLGFFIGSFFLWPLIFGSVISYIISYFNKKKLEKKIKFVKQNQIIFELIQNKLMKEIIKQFEKKLNKNNIIIYNKEKFEDNIKKIKKKIMEKKYIDNLKNILRKNFNVLIVGCTNAGKSTLINEFLKLDEKKKAKEGTGGPTDTKDFTPYTGTNNKNQYTLFDTNGITCDGKDSIENKIKNTLKEINERINSRDPNNLIHCVWYCFQGTNIQTSDRDFIEKLLNIYTTYSIPIIFIHTQTIIKKKSQTLKNGLSNYLNQIFNNDQDKVNEHLKYYIDVLARREEELEKEAFGLVELEEMTKNEIEQKGLKSAYYEYIKQDIIPILINGAFEIIFTGSNINRLYKNASENLDKYYEAIKTILNDKELNLPEHVQKENMQSLDNIYDSFKKTKSNIENELKDLLLLDKMKKENEQFIKNIYEYKSSEYKKDMSYKEFCKHVDDDIYNNIYKNSKETINNMMNICFNMYIMEIIKVGVRKQFNEMEKDEINDIYHEMFKTYK